MVGIFMVGFVVLVSMGALGTAIAYAVRPTERKLGLMRPLTLASVFAAACSTAAGMAVALKHAADEKLAGDSPWVMVAGFTEALVPAILACAFLAVAWLLVTFGLRRQP